MTADLYFHTGHATGQLSDGGQLINVLRTQMGIAGAEADVQRQLTRMIPATHPAAARWCVSFALSALLPDRSAASW
ncbi:MAG: hypothetical protein WDM77_15085 [Steroidobacteraceae bacterium]